MAGDGSGTVSKSIVLSLSMRVLLLLLAANNAEAKTGRLAADEVEALREVGAQLGKKWNFDLDPCSNDTSWATPKSDATPLYNNTVNCNCSFPDGSCHVVNIFLKGQGLAGVLPPSLAKLPYLKAVDFNRNYLNGTIPREWASLQLEYLSLSANRASGQIPSFFGNITTIRYLSFESNLFSGPVPSEFGKLINLETLVLSANNLTGELPESLANLTKLVELRISSNNFTGKIPNFIQSLKSLQKFEIQASGFEGPIPSNISALSNLTELRISDVSGDGSRFPPLCNMKDMSLLMLRNCNISGQIPDYLSEMPQLKILDLSFNRLEGNIPNLADLQGMEFMYLTGNLLTGTIPQWIKNKNARTQVDLSFNNFTESSEPSCRETLNLFKSSRGENDSKVECLENFACTKDRYSLHINCGGEAIKVGDINYEADLESGGPAKYVPLRQNWEISSTGHFWDMDDSPDNYIARNQSVLKMENSELYMRARLSALSLTYYARCLANGNYTVKLHFAEIVIRDNRSFESIGRRIFDVYIQGKHVLKDFDIVNAAQGVDKVFIKVFKSVNVTDGTIDIGFRWAGKGTTNVPHRGVYGPLISAISVQSEFDPPEDSTRKIFIVAGALGSALFIVLMILVVLKWKGYLGGGKTREQELMGLDLHTGIFTFKQIKAATNNFDPKNKLGEGGFGAVYKGVLLDGTIIAVKQLSSKSKQGNREFVTEIGMISGLQHPNLVRLYGCCIEGNQLLLVYEYMENNSLEKVLFEEGQLRLDWPTRQKICVGIAKGLAFLHEESTLKIVHRDIKTTNVLLDRDLNPKISDFGLAKLHEEENTHISTRIAGTIGYMAPEYALWGHLTSKADVYSFGVVALELVAGKNNMKYRPNENFFCLLDWAIFLQRKGDLMQLVDPRLGSKFREKEAMRMIKVALLCTSPSPALRPTMSTVVSMLEGRMPVHELVMDPSLQGDESRFDPLRGKFDQALDQSLRETQSLYDSSGAPGYGSSSTSARGRSS